MFDHLERRMFAQPPELALQIVARMFYEQHGVPMMPIGPGAIRGVGLAGSWGLQPVFMARVYPAGSGSIVDVTVGAELTAPALVCMLLLMVFFWPAALGLGAVGYSDFGTRRSQMCAQIWASLGTQLGGAVAPAAFGASGYGY